MNKEMESNYSPRAEPKHNGLDPMNSDHSKPSSSSSQSQQGRAFEKQMPEGQPAIESSFSPRPESSAGVKAA